MVGKPTLTWLEKVMATALVDDVCGLTLYLAGGVGVVSGIVVQRIGQGLRIIAV